MSVLEDGCLPEGWIWTDLDGIAELINGDRGENYPSKGAFVEQGVPFINAGHLRNGRVDSDGMNFITEERFSLLRSGKVQRGDVLYCLRGSLGKTAVSDFVKGAIASSLIIVRPQGSALARYIHGYLSSPLGQNFIEEYDNGTAQPNLSARNLASCRVPVPPLPEQQRIVEALESYFSRLDEAVALLERAQRNLKRYRASVLQAAVEGRLVPTEAELARAEGRDYEPASALLRRILTERRRRWTESGARGKNEEPAPPDTSGLPALPEGWCWTTVAQVAHEVRYGSSTRTDELLSDGVPVMRMGNIVDGELRYENLKYLPRNHYEFPDLLLQPGDLLFNRTNSAELVGKTAVFRGAPGTHSFASYLIRVRLLGGVVPELVSASINSIRGRTWVTSVAVQQVGQANVNGTKLKAYAIPLPPTAEQTRIVAEMDRLTTVLKANERAVTVNLARLARLRQSILKWAFEGKLVDQDPSDEPAAELLARIRAERGAATPTTKTSRGRPRKVSA